MDLIYMEEKIEKLRCKLVNLLVVTENFVDVNVVSLSQELDIVLLNYELLKENSPYNKRRISLVIGKVGKSQRFM